MYEYVQKLRQFCTTIIAEDCTMDDFGKYCQRNIEEFVSIELYKSDNLQYNMLGHRVDHLIDQASDGPSIILID